MIVVNIKSPITDIIDMEGIPPDSIGSPTSSSLASSSSSTIIVIESVKVYPSESVIRNVAT